MAGGDIVDRMLFTIAGRPSVQVIRNVDDSLPEIIRAVSAINGVASCEAYITKLSREQHIRVRVTPLGGRKYTSATLQRPIARVLNGFAVDPRYFSGGMAKVTFEPSDSQLS